MGNTLEKTDVKAILAERDWWHEIAALFNTKLSGWTGKIRASLINGVQIEDSRIAEKLYKLAMVEAGHMTAAEAAKETAAEAAAKAATEAMAEANEAKATLLTEKLFGGAWAKGWKV